MWVYMDGVLHMTNVQPPNVKVARGRSYITSVPVREETPPSYDIIDLVQQDIDYRFSDTQKRLTAIKDKQLKSCFVNDYDPQWSLRQHDKRRIAGRNSYDAVDTDDKFYQLKKKAGTVIANMCKHEKIFWLTNEVLAPPPFMIGQSNMTPPPLAHIGQHGPPRLSNEPIIHEEHNVGDGNTNGLVEPPPLNIQGPPQLTEETVKSTPPLSVNELPLLDIQQPPQLTVEGVPPPLTANVPPLPVIRQTPQPKEDGVKSPPPLSAHEPPLPNIRQPPPLTVDTVDSPPPIHAVESSSTDRVPGIPRSAISPRLAHVLLHTVGEPPRAANNPDIPPPLPDWHIQSVNEQQSEDNIPPPLAPRQDNSSPPDLNGNSVVAPPPLKRTVELIAPPLPDLSAPTQRKI